MSQEDDIIEGITKRDSKKVWDMWDKVAEQFYKDLDDPNIDIFNSPAIQLLSRLGSFLLGSMEREYARTEADYIKNIKIKELVEAYKPNAASISMIAIQIIGSFAAGAVGCVPAVFGITAQTSISAWQSASNATQGIFGQGGSTAFSLLQSEAQSRAAETNTTIEFIKQVQQDHISKRQQEERLADQHAEDRKHLENARHQAISEMNR